VLNLALERRHELSVLREDGQVEVVVVVGDQDLAVGVDAHPYGVVGDALAADLSQVDALVAEHFDAVGAIVADEDLLLVVDHHAVRELEVLRAAELLQHRPALVEDDDAHHFALDDDDAALVVDGDAARVLQDVGAELPHELTVLVVDLDLVGGRPLRHDDVARGAHHGDAVRVQELSVALAALAELELEAALLVEDLDPVVVGVGDDDVVLGVDRHPARLRELALHHAELAELAVVDHLLALDLRLGREDRRRHQLGGEVEHGVGVAGAAQRVGVAGAVLEHGVGAAVRPLLVRVDAVEVEVADRRRERPQTVGTAESLADYVRLERRGRLARPRHGEGAMDATAAAASVQTARTAVHAAAARAGAACGARDRGLLARSHHRLAVRTDVAEGVAHPHLDRLVVRHELQLARRLDALVDVVTEQALQFRIQQLPDHQDLDDRCALVQSLDELTSLVDLFDRFLAFLRGHAKRYLLGREDALQLFEQLLLALLQHRPVEHERVVDLVLSLVVLHLEAAGHVLDVLQDVAYVGGFGLGFLHSVLDRLDLLGGGLADMFVFVYAGGCSRLRHSLQMGIEQVRQKYLSSSLLCRGHIVFFSPLVMRPFLDSSLISVRLTTLWPSKQCMNW
jgi:hypothetical protein